MFPRVLYLDDQRSLELNWFGIGTLQMRRREGGLRRADPIQKQVFLRVVQAFENAGQTVSPANLKCSNLMQDFAELLEHPPSSLRWKTLLAADLDEVGGQYAQD
ncbi:hypothetical protein [Janthinobacterium lividum]|uniref:hypothetical protein n=1 Tax=Janthinobacterium lividum TaxID=29581 RepID=UPI000E0F8DB8|nr:hypothetical protein [Janthinobacterium lividum]MCC7714686.1 hypothetical protein [Janthinobacterium lividum]WQE30114.1 hypothetical protein U0004_06770 [Janthinobacterium lividum]